MKIYVASSWRNTYQPLVVNELRHEGHEVYDFKDSKGFHWSEVDPKWKEWDAEGFLHGLTHERSVEGFQRDMQALIQCDACVYVMPCGISASLEAGWACGAGKKVLVYIPEFREPELMLKMADCITEKLEDIIDALREGPYKDPILNKAYWFGFDCERGGANEINCHFSIFSSVEKTKAWERGKKDGEHKP